MSIEAIIRNKGSEVHRVAVGTPVRDAVALLTARRIGALPVMDGDEVVGIMSERDIIYCLATDSEKVFDYPVERIMTAPAVTIAPDHDILSALSLMTRRRIRHLPVVDQGRIVGLVSIGDLVKFRMDRIEEEAAQLLNYIQSA